MLNLNEVPELTRLFFWVSWSLNELGITCAYKTIEPKILKINSPTIPCAPPFSLVKWAKRQNLIPIEEYDNEESFRSKVHSCLGSLQNKIVEAGSYAQFWNFQYKGNKVVTRVPKKEVEIHPFIHCILSDQALLASFEVIPEYKTGIGNLDFMIMGKLKNAGMAKICVEFKNAHSDDLMNGYTNQLPQYMRNKEVKYGIYCILNYKGEWFNKPNLGDKRLDIEFMKAGKLSNEPLVSNIRVMYFDLTKPKSASK